MLWVILAVIAVVLFAAWLITRRRSAGVQSGSEKPAAVAPPRAEPAESRRAAEPAKVAVAPVETDAAVELGEESKPAPGQGQGEAAAATAEAVVAVPGGEAESEAAAEETPVAAPAKATPVESLRSEVEAQLEESARLLGELREAASSAEEGSALGAGSVEIMEEGLEEIRALAERKQWGPARDKGKALHAQLTLLLQSARREKSP